MIDPKLGDPICRKCPEMKWCHDVRAPLWKGGPATCSYELQCASWAGRAIAIMDEREKTP